MVDITMQNKNSTYITKIKTYLVKHNNNNRLQMITTKSSPTAKLYVSLKIQLSKGIETI